VPAVFAMMGVPGLWLVNRRAFGLVMSVPLATLAVMTVQRVAPPPRIMSFLAPVFCLLAAAGVVAVFRLASDSSLARRARVSTPADRRVRTLYCLLACAIGLLGFVHYRRQPLPGGVRPAFLVEDVAAWPDVAESGNAGLNQLWRLDVREAVHKVEEELQPGDRILVGLPADLPFHFYAERRGMSVPIGGEPRPDERLFLVLRSREQPATALRENLSLRFTDPWLLQATWQLLATGELAIWLAEPAREPTGSAAP
jgi:hypothetical protein